MLKTKKIRSQYPDMYLRDDFRKLINDFNNITKNISNYNHKVYLELLRKLKCEVDYEFKFVVTKQKYCQQHDFSGHDEEGNDICIYCKVKWGDWVNATKRRV